ncbi:PAS domain-containing protein [Phormidium sp. CCY1219]|uniref:PAS domain-containing protein n=1 Tax=Phormidium sp. CCY1219 TaxID=2886104 RepID=UPI002D1ED710|nr:PAS domain-containing protein [Phormidium sp. CCY1219]MEB3827332.1 PAS domain-containing protein [Phormidium sp. CCY1219]
MTLEINGKSGWNMRQMLDEISEGLLSIDGDSYELLYWNRAAQTLYRCGDEECKENPKCWLEAIYDADRDRVIAAIASFLEGEDNPEARSPLTLDYQILYPDRKITWVRHKFWRSQDENCPRHLDSIITEVGVGVVATVPENTPPTDSPDPNPPPSLDFFQQIPSLAALVPKILYEYIHYADGREEFTYLSSECETICERDAEEILAQKLPLSHFVHPEEVDSFQRSFDRARQSLGQWKRQWRYIAPSGTIKWLLGIAKPIAQPEGAILWQGIILDITTQKPREKTFSHKVRLKELRSQIGWALSGGENRSQMLQRCTEAMVKHLQVAFARVWLFNPNDKMLELQASADRNSHIKSGDASLPMGRWEIGQIAGERKPYLTNDLLNDPLIPNKDWVRREKMVAFAGYPLLVEGQVVGVVVMLSRQILEPETLDILAEITQDMAVAIELKNATEALQTTSERLQVALEGSGLGLWDWNLATGEAYFDPQWKKMLGYEVEELENHYRSWEQLVHPEDLPKAIAALEAHLQGHSPIYDVEIRMLSKSGEWKWILSRGRASQRSASGTFTRLAGVNKDISDRKHTEQALLDSERRCRAIFNCSFQFIALLQPDGTIIEVNQTALDFGGIEAHYIRGRRFWEAHWWQISPETQRELKAAIARAAKGEFIRYEVEIQGKENIRATIDFSIKPIFDNAGQVVLLIPEGRDITEQKQVREALAFNVKRLNRVLSAADDGWWEWNILTGECYFSPRWERMLGYQPNELYPHISTWESLMHPEDLPLAIAQINRHFADSNFPYSIDLRMQAKTGEWKWILCQGKAIEWDDSGNPTRMMGIQKDISGRKQTEEALRKSKKQLQDAQRIAHIGSWEYNVATERVTWSEEVFRIFGLDPELGEPSVSAHLEYIHPADRELWQREIGVSIARGTSFNFDYRIIRSDGSLRYVNGIGEAVCDDRSQVVQLLGTAIDITERKQTEQTLRDREEFLRSIYEGVDVGILIVDVLKHQTSNSAPPTYQFRYSGVNPKMARSSQIPVDYLLGKTLDEALPSSVATQLHQRYLACMESRRPMSCEECFDLNETQKWWLLTYNPLSNSEGEIYRIVVTATDITERKESEEALRESEALFRELAAREELINRLAIQIRKSLDIESILETTVREIRSLLQVDRCHFAWYCSGETGEPFWELVKEAKNPDLPTLLGRYTVDQLDPLAEKLLNKECVKIDNVRDESNPNLQELLVASGHQSVLLLPIETESGEIGLIGCTRDTIAQAWDAEDVELLHAVCNQLAIAIDQAQLYTQSRESAQLAAAKSRQLEQTLRELRTTQANLIQAEKMSSLGQMVAGVAHEINNPVNFIYGNLIHATESIHEVLTLIRLYQQHYPQPTPDIAEEIELMDLEYLMGDLPKMLQSMKVGADRIKEIVKSLRIFSRLDESELKEVDIHENIDSTLMILQNRLKSKSDRHAISVIKDYDNLPAIECYPGQLNQVFMNLLSNAIDALESSVNSHSSSVNSHSSLVTGSSSSVTGLNNQGQTTNDQGQMTNDQGQMTNDQGQTTNDQGQTTNDQGQMTNDQRQTTIRIRTQLTDENTVKIAIADNGMGMKPEVLGKIFDPFYTTKSVGSGTGLGLSISYQIVVEKHGGRLYCTSQWGKGTEFIIEIPRRQP